MAPSNQNIIVTDSRLNRSARILIDPGIFVWQFKNRTEQTVNRVLRFALITNATMRRSLFQMLATNRIELIFLNRLDRETVEAGLKATIAIIV